MTLSTIELYEESLSFAIAHFTLFSPTERERLHGHNYRVQALITAEVSEYGITFDYGIYKKKLRGLCQQLNTFLVLPGKSPILSIKENPPYYQVNFHTDEMQFLQKDVLILPIRNSTLEEFSNWFLTQLTSDQNQLVQCNIREIVIRVSNGPGRFGSAHWHP